MGSLDLTWPKGSLGLATVLKAVYKKGWKCEERIEIGIEGRVKEMEYLRIGTSTKKSSSGVGKKLGFLLHNLFLLWSWEGGI